MSIIEKGPNISFEDIKHIDENGVEYWTARELFPLFGYTTWQGFEEVVKRDLKILERNNKKLSNPKLKLKK